MAGSAKGERQRRGGGKGGMDSRRAARLGAIQALYQMELTGLRPDAVLLEFLQHRLDDEVDGMRLGELDRALFGALVKGVHGARAELDDMIAAVLSEGWTVERLETLLRIILRAGAYELAYRQETPARSVISEYVDLAHGFFLKKEPGMANAMLDRLARVLRAEEFEPDRA